MESESKQNNNFLCTECNLFKSSVYFKKLNVKKKICKQCSSDIAKKKKAKNLENVNLSIPAHCSKCNQYKPTSEFYLTGGRTDGTYPTCKVCCRKRQRDRKLRPDIRDKYRRSESDRHLKKKYGITRANYDELAFIQNNLCAICKTPPTGFKRGRVHRDLCVDHDHKTGNIRELLCIKCNALIGHCNESIEILESAINYLKKHNL